MNNHERKNQMTTLTREFEVCINSCNDVIRTANVCLDAHLGEAEMKGCLKLCLDAIDACAACARTLARHSDYAAWLCEVCADLCDACADECGRFDSEPCADCSKACRTCAEQCRAMAS